MRRLARFAVPFVLCTGCAMGEMPQAAPADGGLQEGEDEGTPLTTWADGGDDGAASEDDDGAAHDGAGTTGGTPDDDGGTPPGTEGDETDGSDGADGSDGGDDANDSSGGALTAGETGDTGDVETDGGDTAETGGDDGPLPDAIDVSDFELVQTDAFRVVTLPAGTLVEPGTYLVIGRDATRAQFEAFWGALPADAVYLDGALLDADTFPTINGGETYELLDPSGAGIDGPSAPLSMLGNMQRLDPGEPAALDPSWASSVDPGLDATPGGGQLDSALFSGIYISEVSDAVGSGSFVYEFIELYHDP